MQLTVSDVSIIARTAKSTRERTQTEAYRLVTLCDQRLKAAGAGELTLAPEVRLDLKAVIRLIWAARKTALAQWKRAKEEAAILEQLEADRRGEHLEYLAVLGQVV